MSATAALAGRPTLGWRGAAALLPALLSFLVLAAHFFRAGELGLVGVALAAPLLLLGRWRWAVRVLQGLLVLGAAEWIRTARALAEMRIAFHQDWLRMALILGGVAAFALVGVALLSRPRVLEAFDRDAAHVRVSTAAFALTAGLLAFVSWRVERPMILADRFLPGAGDVEILALAAWAAFLSARLMERRDAARWRVRAWTLFSVVFFGQLLLGLLGFDRFLQTGTLHLPVPALIVGGPLYRGEHFFMPILFASTVLLVGPAWCSHLCYIGAWDQNFSLRKRIPRRLPRWRGAFRVGSLLVVIAGALLLRLLGASPLVATLAGAAFGLLGVGVMAWWSRRTGQMVHCTAWCPIGLVSTFLGRINPFRVKISADTCTQCMACVTACRYDALSRESVSRHEVGGACTLCGDCLQRCDSQAIHMEFPGLKPAAARALFVVIVVSLHASFLGLARI